jgi:hypothetical protein
MSRLIIQTDRICNLAYNIVYNFLLRIASQSASAQ